MKKNQILKLVFFLLLSLAVYIQVLHHKNVNDIWANFILKLDEGHTLIILFAFLLMPLNWYFEFLKWRILTQDFLEQSNRSALKSVFAGITVSIFTPNRIGEYGGRMLFVGQQSVGKVIVASIVGSIAQWITIFGFGLFSLIMVRLPLLGLPYNPWLIVLLAIVLYGMLLAVYFNLWRLGKIGTLSQKGWKRRLKPFSVLKSFSFTTLFRVLLYSVLRFLTYTTQYVLILIFFTTGLNPLDLVMKVMSIFLAQLAIPVPPFMAVFSRAEVALMLLKSHDINELAVISSTFLLWIINLIIPAIIGVIIIVREKKFKLFKRRRMF